MFKTGMYPLPTVLCTRRRNRSSCTGRLFRRCPSSGLLGLRPFCGCFLFGSVPRPPFSGGRRDPGFPLFTHAAFALRCGGSGSSRFGFTLRLRPSCLLCSLMRAIASGENFRRLPVATLDGAAVFDAAPGNIARSCSICWSSCCRLLVRPSIAASMISVVISSCIFAVTPLYSFQMSLIRWYTNKVVFAHLDQVEFRARSNRRLPASLPRVGVGRDSTGRNRSQFKMTSGCGDEFSSDSNGFCIPGYQPREILPSIQYVVNNHRADSNCSSHDEEELASVGREKKNNDGDNCRGCECPQTSPGIRPQRFQGPPPVRDLPFCGTLVPIVSPPLCLRQI